jgi:hypothetical protein
MGNITISWAASMSPLTFRGAARSGEPGYAKVLMNAYLKFGNFLHGGIKQCGIRL